MPIMDISPCNFSLFLSTLTRILYLKKLYSLLWKNTNLNCLFFVSFAVILNSNDFDFLLSRGAPSGQINPRDSILERFDPISGRKSIVLAPLINKVEPISIAAAPSVSTILEADNSICESVKSNESLVSTDKSPTAQTNVVINEIGDNEQIAKLESIEKFEANIGGDGDNSQASSTTETYETASIGEPLKVIKKIWILSLSTNLCPFAMY